MSRELVVGCPIRDRAWILPAWFEHLARAVKAAQLEPLLVFVGDLSRDEAMFELIDALARPHGWFVSLVNMEEPEHEPYTRVWNIGRYQQMAKLRNALLTEVQKWEPRFFWSLDSDILAHENALVSAVDALDRFEAVGQRCYMTVTGTSCPSYCNITDGGGLLRSDAEGCFPVDVIMASKVMSWRAYDVAYEIHEQGEDIGWSKACARFGVKLGWDGRTISKHVMGRDFLEPIDVRCGY